MDGLRQRAKKYRDTAAAAMLVAEEATQNALKLVADHAAALAELEKRSARLLSGEPLTDDERAAITASIDDLARAHAQLPDIEALLSTRLRAIEHSRLTLATDGR
ncbi:MAG TPA: hypothetical protein VFA59_06635 [Vicinamibacterales bacterium]|nr:hypothetical protein [Vicinamibacterales bacterium]